jgi:hypothetical protein
MEDIRHIHLLRLNWIMHLSSANCHNISPLGSVDAQTISEYAS